MTYPGWLTSKHHSTQPKQLGSTVLGAIHLPGLVLGLLCSELYSWLSFLCDPNRY